MDSLARYTRHFNSYFIKFMMLIQNTIGTKFRHFICYVKLTCNIVCTYLKLDFSHNSGFFFFTHVMMIRILSLALTSKQKIKLQNSTGK